MTILARLLGFPRPEQRDAVRFHFAKSLDYQTRMALAPSLLFLGAGLQVTFLSLWPGLPFLLAAVGLVIVKGYDSRVRLKHFQSDPGWTTVPLAKIQEMVRLRRRTQKWDSDALDVSNALGIFMLTLVACAAGALGLVLGLLSRDVSVTAIVWVDLAILTLPLWFTGMKFILKQPNLDIRTDLILKMHRAFEAIKKEGEEFKPAIMLARDKDGKQVPVDARFTVSFPFMPQDFYGLQAQININLVQGHSYPYFYCVLAAKRGFGLRAAKDRMVLSRGIICEFQEEPEVEVLVIRQKTTKKTGYHTKPGRCGDILRESMEEARKILAANN